MKALLSVLVAIALMASAGGCAMSQNTFDDQYAAYGGSQTRADMTYGRVGSRFGSLDVAGDIPPEPGHALPVPDEAGTDYASPEI